MVGVVEVKLLLIFSRTMSPRGSLASQSSLGRRTMGSVERGRLNLLREFAPG